MNLKNIGRKVVAVGTGVAMVGATLMGALAANLNEYPAPFVTDGAFDAVLVVGDNADPVDIIGVTDVAMALQYGMTTEEAVETTTGETTVTGGEVEDELAIGADAGAKTYDDGDIAVLRDSDVRYDGEDENFEETIVIADGFLNTVTGQDNEDWGTGVYMEVDKDATSYYLWEPDSPIEWSDDDLEIEFLGMDLTLTNSSTSDSVVLSTAAEVWMDYGESITWGDYTITLDNVYDTEVVITVNSVTENIEETEQEDFGFEDFEIELLSALNDDGTENDVAKIKYGTTTSETATDGTAAEMLGYGDDDTEAEWQWRVSANGTHLTHIGVQYNQDRDELADELTEDWELPVFELGDVLNFPNNYAQIEFAGVRNNDNREEFTVKAEGGSDYTWYQTDNSTAQFDDDDVMIFDSDSEIFLWEGTEYEEVIVGFTMSDGVGLKDSNGNKVGADWNATGLSIKVDEDTLTVAFGNNSDNLTTVTLEDVGLSASDLVWTPDWEDGDDAVAADMSYSGTNMGTRDYDFMTDYGVIIYDVDSSIADGYGEIKLSYPTDDVQWEYAVAAESSVTSTSEVTTQSVTQIEVGSAKLASEVADVTAQNAIVIGGPCANSAAATLMGNPSPCYAGFTEGEATVKLFENGGNVAMLIAGATGDDTRTAAKLVADGTISSVDGMEAVVTTLTEAVTAPTAVSE